jgi:hypothetical protein
MTSPSPSVEDEMLETQQGVVVEVAVVESAASVQPAVLSNKNKGTATRTIMTMKEWFQSVSSDEVDAMIALQLDYRFMGDNFSSYWWIHFHALGFKHTKGTAYELPPSYSSNSVCRPRNVVVPVKKQEQEKDNHDHPTKGKVAGDDSSVHESTAVTAYDANGLYEELDSLAIPQINSAFDHMPPEQMGSLRADKGGNPSKQKTRQEIDWWRSIRDELIFRKFHKDIEKEYGRGYGKKSTSKSTKATTVTTTQQHGRHNNNNNDDDHDDDPTDTSNKHSGNDVAVNGRTKRTRQSREFYSDAGADLLINNTRKKKGRGVSLRRNAINTDNNTKKWKSVNTTNKDNDPRGDNATTNDTITAPVEFPSLVEYADMARTYKRHELDAIEQDLVDQTFEEWRFLASTNHSLLIYGVGSKKRLLERLAEEELDKDGDVVQIDGYDRDITIESILETLVDHWLGGEEPIVNPLNLFQGQRQHDCTGLSYYPQQQGSTTSIIQKAARIAHEMATIVGQSLRPIYIVLHNIDGIGLRNHTAQEALATLISQSFVPQCGLNAIRLIASIDHVNGPTLLWNTTSRHRFRWMWKEAHTQRPYIDEVLQSQKMESDKLKNRKKSKKSKNGLMDGGGDDDDDDDDDEQQLCWEESILPVLVSLAARHTQALQQLAWLQLKENNNNNNSTTTSSNNNIVGVWVPYVDLLNQCRLKCVVTADNQLRNYLGELIDHGIVEKSKNYGSSISTYRIPYSTVILDLIVQYTMDP